MGMVCPSLKEGLESKSVNGVAVGGITVAVAGIAVDVDVDVGCTEGDDVQAATINASVKSRIVCFIVHLFIKYFLGSIPRIAK